MSSQLTENWPSQFTQYLNASNLEAVVTLYEADAKFVRRLEKRTSVATGSVTLSSD